MIASALAFLAALVKGVVMWLEQKREQLLIALGGQKQKVEDLESRLDSIEAANKARQSAESKTMKNPGTILDDDGFMRGDDNA